IKEAEQSFFFLAVARAGFCRGSNQHGAGVHLGRRTPADGPPLAPTAAGFSAPPLPRSAGSPRYRQAAVGAAFALPLAGACAADAPAGRTRRRRRPPCPACGSPPRLPARRPRGTACCSPCEEEEAAAAEEEEAPPPWQAPRPGGLGRTHGGFLARSIPAGRRPPRAAALGPLAAAALAFRLRVRGGRAVAEPGPHQDPLVRQHRQRAGSAGRRRHRAPCGAPGPRGRYAAGHRAQMEQIKRANKLFTNDCIFLKKTLNIPVISEKPLLFNGLNSIDSPENEIVDNSFSQEEEPVVAGEDLPPPSPQESDVQPVQPEEVSARDFLQRLDLQIKLSTQAAKKLKEESRDEESPYATSLYHS
uniref:LysM domain containing 2 n=1 Tax=Macaca mulatta TaxID=9544 RepID=F7HMQ3_MACMU